MILGVPITRHIHTHFRFTIYQDLQKQTLSIFLRSNNMQARYVDIFQSLINEIKDAEHKFDLALKGRCCDLAYSDGIRHSLETLKEERFENAVFYKSLEERSDRITYWAEKSQGNVYLNLGQNASSLWEDLQELAKRFAQEDPNEVMVKRVKFEMGDARKSDSDENEVDA
jgi:hypothetical protein